MLRCIQVLTGCQTSAKMVELRSLTRLEINSSILCVRTTITLGSVNEENGKKSSSCDGSNDADDHASDL